MLKISAPFRRCVTDVTKNPIDNANNRILRDSHRKYFLQRVVNITNYNVLIDGRNFYDQPIDDQIKKDDEIIMIATGRRDGYSITQILNFGLVKSS